MDNGTGEMGDGDDWGISQTISSKQSPAGEGNSPASERIPDQQRGTEGKGGSNVHSDDQGGVAITKIETDVLGSADGENHGPPWPR